ncbi:MAG: S-layer homology domain-containing protein [Chloroflexota bacterium]
MRKLFILFGLILACAGIIATAGTSSYAQKGDAYGGRPPMFTPGPIEGPFVKETPVPAGPVPPKGTVAFPPVSMFGMNLYLTGLERSLNQANQLGQMAAAGGVKWSREELSWANIEPNEKGSFNWTRYDQQLASNFNNGIQVIGMLLTTPRWASTNPGASDWYWYEPGNYNDYYDYVRSVVNRWKNNIHVWEIWNEPNHAGTWNCLNNCDRAAHYAQLLQGAYVAVKSVDPTARVLIGGLYVHDTNNEGIAFLNNVVAASGGQINFDGMSIHTYMPDRIPEAMDPQSVVQNYQYRLNMVNDWIDAHGGNPAEIWITEEGRSTCVVSGSCPPNMTWSEDDQASMLARMYGISAATRRVVQYDYFQLEDKFNNPANLYGGMSVVRDNLTTKPAYDAYRTISAQLDGATFVGPGPQMIPGNNPNQPDNSDYVGFDYKFHKGSQNIHMVWRVNGSATVSYPVLGSPVSVVDRDGGVTQVVPTNGTIQLTISARPQYVVMSSCTSRFNDVCPDFWAYPYIECLASRNILSGYADGSFRPNNLITRGQLSKVVSNAAGFVENRTGQTFQDIVSGSTYYQFVERLASRGVISGYPCGGAGEPCGAGNKPYFRPNANTTRGQIAKIVASAKGYTEPPSGQTFQDVPPSNTFYAWIQRLATRSVMSGYPCGGAGESCVAPGNRPYFRPAVNASRAQVSKIVANTFFPECQP